MERQINRVCDLDLRQFTVGAMFDQRAGRAQTLGFFDKFRRIKTGPAQRHEQLTGTQRTSVRTHGIASASFL